MFVYRHSRTVTTVSSTPRLPTIPCWTADELRPAVDNLAYRAQRILLPALAWLLAAGQPAWIVQVYAVLNLAGWLMLAALLVADCCR